MSTYRFFLLNFGTADIWMGYSRSESSVEKTDGDEAEQSTATERNIERSSLTTLLAFDYVFEYCDGNAEAGFQPGSNDTITGWYNLRYSTYFSGARKWDPFSCTKTTVPASGTEEEFDVHSCEANTQDDVFKFRASVADGWASVQGHTLRPSDVKIDVDLTWFNNSNMPVTDPISSKSGSHLGPSSESCAQLCVSAHMFSRAKENSLTIEREQSVNEGTETRVTYVSGDGTRVLFDFDLAELNGANVNLQRFEDLPDTLPRGSDVKRTRNMYKNKYSNAEWLLFCFDAVRPEATPNVAWDPELRVEEPAAESSDPGSDPISGDGNTDSEGCTDCAVGGETESEEEKGTNGEEQNRLRGSETSAASQITLAGLSSISIWIFLHFACISLVLP
uniref:Uncharacterized protein n=1 Tax=Chromera velia CCMP2878 TaxID=1169474 RepID=A0A0G4HN19_9ALVE|eukprot:Cvel_7549.t1-p1 / transcript=Cvel_7549.t1 / gene=Cvel_7549 / organism=Chromera_velia_CCMP2878 / gene_product=hypothetical protein / transcript_product=hypothetical protein / location=Cvel_scaffold397:11649-12818(-) / protein_length=390 / sequence_SO=supercontig / SO=protein_coding / is_pseudo=false